MMKKEFTKKKKKMKNEKNENITATTTDLSSCFYRLNRRTVLSGPSKRNFGQIAASATSLLASSIASL
jgi:hypothetical protein